jgi:hypothetical protein
MNTAEKLGHSTVKRKPEKIMAKKEKLLRSKDVAHILDCSPDDVILLARKGKLRALKQGRFWRYRYADVMVYKKRYSPED